TFGARAPGGGGSLQNAAMQSGHHADGTGCLSDSGRIAPSAAARCRAALSHPHRVTARAKYTLKRGSATIGPNRAMSPGGQPLTGRLAPDDGASAGPLSGSGWAPRAPQDWT